MITKIVLAVIVAVAVGLLSILLGGVLLTLNVPITDAVGGFLKTWGWVLGVLAGAWYFFSGGFTFTRP